MSLQIPGFLGRIVRFPVGIWAAASGVKGPHQVWFPISKADVATAVQHAQKLTMFVRSGLHAAAATDAVDASGGVVINLAELKNVDINNGVVAEVATSRMVKDRDFGGVLHRYRISLSVETSSGIKSGPSIVEGGLSGRPTWNTEA